MDPEEVMKSVKAQIAMAQVQELVSRMSEKCFAKVFIHILTSSVINNFSQEWVVEPRLL